MEADIEGWEMSGVRVHDGKFRESTENKIGELIMIINTCVLLHMGHICSV